MITSLINQLLFVSLSAQTADSGASSRSNPAAVRSRWTFPWLELAGVGLAAVTISVTFARLEGSLGGRSRCKSLKRLGTPGRIRTCDLRIRSPLLYPAELRAPGSILQDSWFGAKVATFLARRARRSADALLLARV